MRAPASAAGTISPVDVVSGLQPIKKKHQKLLTLFSAWLHDPVHEGPWNYSGSLSWTVGWLFDWGVATWDLHLAAGM